ncbi:MAG: NAD(P)H-hydrate dehydratase, partial [Pedobacter sp.]
MANRLSDFLPDSDPLSEVQVVGKGMSNSGDSYQLIREQDINAMLKPRNDFSHKGTYGHALIIAGEHATMGAALLASSGCLYAGAGLISACIPESGLTALNTALPEVMYQSRDRVLQTEVFDRYNAVAIGPGLGLEEEAVALLSRVIEQDMPIIADADALNLLSINSLLMQGLSRNSILTPHM